MALQSSKIIESQKALLLKTSRIHFIYIAAYMLAIIIFDSWNLLAHEAVIQRWTLAVIFLIINTVIWYACRLNIASNNVYKGLFWLLIITDIIFASVNVYWQRGMASKAVMLYAVPLITAAITRSRSLLIATSSLSAAGYSIAAVRYFFENYGQGFRVELYGEVGFYAALFFIVASLLLIMIRPASQQK